jgi:hypothetical protein
MARRCPCCRAEYADHADVCWSCRVRLVPTDESEEPDRELVWVDLRPVYRAPDEFSALAVERVLAAEDIRSFVRSGQIPWADGIMSNLTGFWGQVLVAPEDYEPALALVTEYLASLERGGDPGHRAPAPGSEV